MAEPIPGSTPAVPEAAPKPTPPVEKPRNPAFKAMGLPQLPKRLPSRNWLIFWTVSTTIAGCIIYDKREKKRATEKWRRVVAPLSQEKLSSANQLPRKLTIYIASAPGDGLRATQDHYIEYVKPVLAESGLDWEFIQARQQGDVRAAVAERIRRVRRETERPGEEVVATEEATLAELRKKMDLPEYEGMKGDIVIGHSAWKEYVRGLHEGWLGPLDAPVLPTIEPPPQPEVTPQPEASLQPDATDAASTEEKKEDEEKKVEEEKKEEKKPDRPPQPIPYNKPEDYNSAALPAIIPAEFSPSIALPFPHRLGFSHTFVRLAWFFNRRKLADSIGRDVTAVCYGVSRDWRSTEENEYEQQLIQKHEEKDWPKSVWKDEKLEDGEPVPLVPKEKVWTNPMVIDSRIGDRMRRFEITPELEARASEIKVPEEKLEGWIKGKFRAMGQWGMGLFEKKHPGPNVGNVDDE